MPMYGKAFHMNPQAGKALHGKPAPVAAPAAVPGAPGTEGGDYDGHDHNGAALASSVEIHKGANPQGNPPMEDGFHTITNAQDGSQDVQNHASYDEASEAAKNSLHVECPACGADIPLQVEEGDDEAAEQNDGGTD